MALARWQRTITDNAGNVLAGATVEVRREVPGQPLAPVFSDRAGLVPIGNPFLTDANGFAAFHAGGGAYQIKATSGVLSQTWRYVAIGTFSESDNPGTTLLRESIGEETFNLYVDPVNGDDDVNDGRQPETPFETLIRALHSAVNDFDFRHPTSEDVTVVINLADGIYDGGGIQHIANPTGKIFDFIIRGNPAAPENTVVTKTIAGGKSAAALEAELQCWISFEHVTLQADEGEAVYVKRHGTVYIGPGCRFGPTPNGAHLYAAFQGQIVVAADYDIVGGGMHHMVAEQLGFIDFAGKTVTLTGTPHFSDCFMRAMDRGLIRATSNTFNGGATGTRFKAFRGGYIKAETSDREYLPGDAEGSTDTTSIYGFGSHGPGYGSVRIHRNDVDQTGLVGGTDNKIDLTAADFDADAVYNLGTDHYTPQVRGIYEVSLKVRTLTSAAGEGPQSMVRKNGGAEDFRGTYIESGLGNAVECHSDLTFLVEMNGTTDILEPYVWMPSGVTVLVGLKSSTSFHARLVRPT